MHRVWPLGILLLCWGVPLGCNRADRGTESIPPPNVIWLVAEDQSPEFFPMYGDNTLALPNLQGLADDGVVYTNAYTPVPVCAPARSSIITGMYPTTLGTHNMRTYTPWADENQPSIGIPSYSPIPPQGVKMFTEILRKHGYYCTNNPKEDYNFRPSPVAWDESSGKAHWRNRPAGSPFFSVFNFNVCHESQIWQRGQDSLWVAPEEVPVPPYFPDNPTVRHDLAVNYSNLGRMDSQVGAIIDQLKEDGLYENSYIFFYSDHGGPFPRHKRALYETGVRVPLIVKFPGNRNSGGTDPRLFSFIDLAPTILSIAGIEPPKVMQGSAQLGTYRDSTEREYLYFTSDRFDEVYDRLRALRWGNFKYIRNFNTGISNALPVSYREQMPLMQSLRALHERGELDSLQELWFRTPKPEEELYDISEDPYELNNLAGEEDYLETLLKLRGALDEWMDESIDLGRYPESELIDLWLIDGHQPELPPLEIVEKNDSISLHSEIPDATLLWRKKGSEIWEFYREPIPASQAFSAKSTRIGYDDSPALHIDMD